MEENQYLMWMKRRQVLKSHIQAPFDQAFNNNSSWEERAFAEDAARILGGCIWPPRSYSCNFCKREFRSAQALGGHMNVHRRDRARLKQSLSSHNNDESLNRHHHKNDCKSLGDAHQFSADQNSSQLDSCLNPIPYSSSLADGTVTTSKISSSVSSNISTQEDLFQHNMSHYSISWGKKMMGSPDSEPEGLVNIAREQSSKGLSCNNYGCVETGLSVGLNSVFRQKLPTDSCGNEDMAYKRPKTSSLSSLPVPVFLKPCSNDNRLAFQSAESVLGLKPGMEDLDLELRLGKPQKA